MAADPFNVIPSRRRIQSGGAEGILDIVEIVGLPLGMNGWDDHFQGDTLHGSYQSTASGANSAVAAISTGLAGGAILLDPGDANAGRCDLSLGRHYYGQNNATIWWKVQINTVTNYKFELGFTDVISGTDAGAVATKSTPTFNADDFVGIVVDTTHNAIPSLMGVAATVAGTSIPFTGLTALSAATYYYFGVSLRGTSAKGMILDADAKLIDQTAWMSAAITADVLLTPWAFVQNRSGAQHAMTIDRVKAYQRDTTAAGA